MSGHLTGDHLSDHWSDLLTYDRAGQGDVERPWHWVIGGAGQLQVSHDTGVKGQLWVSDREVRI